MVQKHEYEADWLKSDFIPLESEIVIYDAEADQNGNLFEGVKLPDNRIIPFNYARIKIGDGQTKINDLPFIDGVGQGTPEGGEIFNDYENNKAIGEGASATGLNTQAGNKAFKILGIEKNEYKTIDGVEVLWFDSYKATPGVYELQGVFESGTIRDNVNEGCLNDINSNSSSPFYITWGEDSPIVDGETYLINYNTEWDDEGGYPYFTVNWIKHIDSNIVDGSYNITIDGNVLEGAEPYAVDDIAQIICRTDVNNSYKIHSISDDGSIICVVKADNRVVQAPKIHPEDPEGKKNWFYVAGKDNGIICPALMGATVSGINSIAAGYGATAMGSETHANGPYATTFGSKNKAAYSGVAGGEGSEAGNYGVALGNHVSALGDGSVATGTNTKARSASSRAGGRDSVANAEYSVAEGLGVKTDYRVPAQVVIGKYNKTSSTDLFVIGNGNSDTDRSNVFAIDGEGNVKANGKFYSNGEEVASKEDCVGQLTENGGVVINNAPGNSSCTATGLGAFAAGNNTQAINRSAVAFGERTTAKYISTFAAGLDTLAAGYASAAIGYGTQTSTGSTDVVGGQAAVGRYNKVASDAMFIVGNGYQDANKQWVRQNAFEVKNDGSAIVQNQGTKPNSVVIKSTLDSNIADVNDKLEKLKSTKANLASIPVEVDIIDIFDYIEGTGIYTLNSIDVSPQPDDINPEFYMIYCFFGNKDTEEQYGRDTVIHFDSVELPHLDKLQLIQGDKYLMSIDNHGAVMQFEHIVDLQDVLSIALDSSDTPGEYTEDGGEIFNDYTANKAVGFGASASGRNSKAGSRAFKILSIEESVGNLPILGDTDYITNEYIKSYYNKLTESQVCTVRWHYTEYDTAVEVYDKDDNLIFTEYWSEGSGNDGIEEEKHYVEVDSGGNVVSIKEFLGYTEGVTGGYDITVRGDVTISGHNEPYSIGDLLQIECKGHLNNSYKIAKISISGDNSIITAEKVDERIISAPVLETSDPNNEENWLYVAGKNGAEISPQLTAAFVAGDGNIATGWASTAFGRDNIASGNYSTAIGRQNIAGYCGFSGGRRSESGE